MPRTQELLTTKILSRIAQILSDQSATTNFVWARDLPGLLRTRQWSKNLLIFVPILVGHDFNVQALSAASLAMVVFCLAASSTYILNDLLDIEADRLHQFKRERPIARGAISGRHAVAVALVLCGAAFSTSFMLLPAEFTQFLGVYVAAASMYSVVIKRMLGLDVVVLGLLYTLRVMAGDEAIGSDSSEWIIAFALFFFLSLALIKRFTELSFLLALGGDRAPSRAYKVDDLRVMIPLAAAAGFSAVAIFSRFIGSKEVTINYSHPERLWYIVPILIYWLIRLMLLANRLKVKDDPVVYATTDNKSILCGFIVATLLIWAW